MDLGGALCPRGGPGPLSPGPLQPLWPLQAGQEQRHGGGRPQPVQCYVVRLGGPAQQRHWRRWGKSLNVKLEKLYFFPFIFDCLIGVDNEYCYIVFKFIEIPVLTCWQAPPGVSVPGSWGWCGRGSR